MIVLFGKDLVIWKKISSRESLDKYMELLVTRIDGILKYIKDNPNSDPNAFEMNDIMFDVTDVGYFGRFFEDEPYGFLHDVKYNRLRDKFGKMMGCRLSQLVSEEQGLHCDKLYAYFWESTRCMATLNRLSDKNNESVKNLFNSICGVDLYIHQRIRELTRQNNIDEVIYDNDYENTSIILKYEDYKELVSIDIRSYGMRDDLIDNLYNEIQDSYQKSLVEVRSISQDNKKM